MENLFATLHYGLPLKQTEKEAPNREPTSGFYQDLELLMSPTWNILLDEVQFFWGLQ